MRKREEVVQNIPDDRDANAGEPFFPRFISIAGGQGVMRRTVSSILESPERPAEPQNPPVCATPFAGCE